MAASITALRQTRMHPVDIEMYETGAVHGDPPIQVLTQVLLVRRAGRVLVCADGGAGPSVAIDLGESGATAAAGAVARRGDPHQIEGVLFAGQTNQRFVRLDIYDSGGCGCGSPLKSYNP